VIINAHDLIVTCIALILRDSVNESLLVHCLRKIKSILHMSENGR